ncbi:LacI family DNA-binding transcriptional regulator [Pseudoroseomonas cervicalis]|uniref:LacI family DNA-binding transcriptional regulator n=1 Tax=Teichococcus cervicalis TaxID=204525 RepID=UPI0022F17BB2|nr:LacI family DNA-binding transcriptional regulator [Pseudoroseomonas cervicalis]WBV45300.1 LacI family DNA-binding transcriptional regulator [Pseudoroseomonas cervicalis]
MDETPPAPPGRALPPAWPAGRITLQALAQRAGVAVSTVSRALKDDPRISPEMRARIAALAAEAGYTPNILARTLVLGRSGLIGLVLGPVENPFYAELMQQAVAQAAARGHRLLLLHAGPGPIEDATAEALLQYRVDGCLITSAELSSRAAAICAANGVPLVMVNRVAREHGSAVSCDNRATGEALAGFLLRTGHRRPAIILGNPGSSTSAERADSFAAAFQQAGLPAPRRFAGGASHAAGYAAGQAIAGLPAAERPDAVFGVGDILAMGAMDALREAGVAVPGDISVVGADGIGPALRPPYRLTTVVQPLEAMVARGLDLLLARIGGAELPQERILLRGRLVEGGSARRGLPGLLQAV